MNAADTTAMPHADRHPCRVLVLEKVLPYPPAQAGDAVYSRGLVEALSRKMAVTVLCADSGAPRRDADGIDWQVTGPQRGGQAGSLLSRWPLIAWKGATDDYRKRLSKLLEQSWKAVILDNIGTGHALPALLRYRRDHPDTRLIYVSHEYEHQIRGGKYGAYGMGRAKRLAAALDLRKVRRLETRLLRETDLVTVINDSDLAPFRRIARDQRFLTVTPGYDGPVRLSRTITAGVPRRVLLLGGRRAQQKRRILLDWMEAAYAPLTEAGIEMVIAGDMDDSLRAELRDRWPKAQVPGFVEDIAALIDTARIGIIADTVGGGFKLRLLSHVFQRLPIVGLNEAIDGLPTPEGRGYLGAPDLAALARLVVATIDDTDRLDALQNAAFADCDARFSWETRAEDLAREICAQQLPAAT